MQVSLGMKWRNLESIPFAIALFVQRSTCLLQDYTSLMNITRYVKKRWV